jgi:hypothetical protein
VGLGQVYTASRGVLKVRFRTNFCPTVSSGVVDALSRSISGPRLWLLNVMIGSVGVPPLLRDGDTSKIDET